MTTRQRLRERELHDVRELVAHCRDSGHDLARWRLRLLAGLCRLISASYGCALEIVVKRDQLQRLGPVSFGWTCEQHHQLWSHLIRDQNPLADAAVQRLYQQHQRRRRLLTATREKLLGDHRYGVSAHHDGHGDAAGLHSCIYSWCPLAAGDGELDAADVIAVHRAVEEEPFGEWERRMVAEVHRQIGPLVGKHLASARAPSVEGLSRRLRQTLQCLLEGGGEKVIAAQLGVRPATVHQYVSALHRHFDVGTRSQLVARWIRYGPPVVLPADLPARHRQTLQLLLEGASEAEIAEQLALSVHTVHQYVSALLRRFYVTSRGELMALWIGTRVDVRGEP